MFKWIGRHYARSSLKNFNYAVENEPSEFLIIARDDLGEMFNKYRKVIGEEPFHHIDQTIEWGPYSHLCIKPSVVPEMQVRTAKMAQEMLRDPIQKYHGIVMAFFSGWLTVVQFHPATGSLGLVETDEYDKHELLRGSYHFAMENFHRKLVDKYYSA